MASGSFNLNRTSGTSYLTVWIEWSSKSNGSSKNSSDVTATMKAKRTNTGYTTYGSGTFKISINGTEKSTSKSYSIGSSEVTLFTVTQTVSHNDDGTKSIVIKGEYSGDSPIAGNGSKTVTLDKIARYATSSQSLKSKTETSITMSWSSDSTIDYIWYSKNGGSSWTAVGSVNAKSGSYTISGLSANTAYSIKTRVRRKDSQLTTDSSVLSVTTYAYPYANSMPNFTIGNTLTIGIYNPLGRTFSIAIIGVDNSELPVSGTYSGTTVSGFNNASAISFFYASIPNAKSGTYKVKVTYNSSVITKTGGTYSINSKDCLPEIGAVNYQDTNSETIGITENNQQIIRNQSILQYIATGLITKNYATIRSCIVTINSNSYSLNIDGTTAIGGNAVVDSSSDITATFTLTDSRGLTVTKDITIQMLDWILPTAIIDLQRQNNFYSETNINVNADYSYLDGKNTIMIKVRYKKVADVDYGDYTVLQDNVKSVLVLDNNYEWNVQVVVQDLFGTTTYNLTVQIGMPIIFFDRLLSSTGFNCFPKREKTIENNGQEVLMYEIVDEWEE